MKIYNTEMSKLLKVVGLIVIILEFVVLRLDGFLGCFFQQLVLYLHVLVLEMK